MPAESQRRQCPPPQPLFEPSGGVRPIDGRPADAPARCSLRRVQGSHGVAFAPPDIEPDDGHHMLEAIAEHVRSTVPKFDAKAIQNTLEFRLSEAGTLSKTTCHTTPERRSWGRGVIASVNVGGRVFD